MKYGSRKNYIVFFTIIVILFTLIYACKKDKEQEHDKNIQLIKSSKQFFNDQVLDKSQVLSEKLNFEDYNGRHLLGKELLWSEAKVKSMSVGEVVIIPIKYSKNLYLKKGNDKVELSKTSYLLIYTDDKLIKHAEWVTVIPHADRSMESNKFRGIVLIEDWFGNLKRGFAIGANGKIMNVTSVESSLFKNVSARRSIYCYDNIHYEYAYMPGSADIYWHSYSVETVCYGSEPGEGGGGGSGSNGPGGGGNGGSGGGGGPYPEEYIDPVTGESTTTPSATPVLIEIKKDSLTTKYPCATKLVLNELEKLDGYNKLVEPFLMQGWKPDITWNANAQPWGVNNNYSAGTSNISSNSRSGISSDINFNIHLLDSASVLLITATAIHETYHAYINYMFYSGNLPDLLDKSKPSFMAGWYQYIEYMGRRQSDPNYIDHYNMITSQFDNMTGILYKFNNGNVSIDDCRKAMLFGMDNPGVNASTGQAQMIAKAYSDLLTKFGFTPSQINSFNLKNLKAISADRLQHNCP